jgi:hypothetical protein
MKTRLLLLACLCALTVDRAEAAFTSITATVQRLTITDYQLDVSYWIAPEPWEYPNFDWVGVYPGMGIATLTGNFSPSPYIAPSYSFPGIASTIFQPNDFGTLFLTVDASQTWVFEGITPGGFPNRYFLDLFASANFFTALPQEIGASSTLTQTPEASSFALLSLGLLPLGLLFKRGRERRA